MSRQTVRFSFITALLLTFVSMANGQLFSERFFVEGQFRANMYSGERSTSGNQGLRSVLSRLGPGATLGMGYTLSKSFEVVGEWTNGNYPDIDRNTGNFEYILQDKSSQNLWGINTSVCYRFWEILGFKPFISSVLGLVSGKMNSQSTTGWGPLWGIGATRPLLGLTLTGSISQLFVYANGYDSKRCVYSTA